MQIRRIQERMEEIERERTRCARQTARSGAGARARVAAARADGARAPAGGDDARAAPRRRSRRRSKRSSRRMAQVKSLDSAVHRYHDGTKHHFHRSPGRSATSTGRRSPIPFDRSPARRRSAVSVAPASATATDHLLSATVSSSAGSPQRAGHRRGDRRSAATCARPVGLEAVRRIALVAARQPSSGNLHPTEAYVVCGALPGLAAGSRLPLRRRSARARARCAFDAAAWTRLRRAPTTSCWSP